MKLKRLLTLTTTLAMLMTFLAVPGGYAQEESIYPEELTIFCSLSEHMSKVGCQTLNDTYFFQEVERITGTHINWIHPAVGSDTEAQINLMVASNDLPDLIVNHDWKNFNGGAALWAEDGVICDLTDLIPENMPYYNAYLEETKYAKQDLSIGGRMYYISEIQHGLPFAGPIFREDWLEKLGLDYPETIDELYDVLVAFRDQDPNGNGQKDEWAMSGLKVEDNNWSPANLLWPFGIRYDFMQIDGQVTYGMLQPEFAEGIAFIRKLYEEGLLDPDYATQDRNSLDGKYMNDLVGFEFGLQPSKMNKALADTTSFKAADGPNLKRDAQSAPYVFHPMYTTALTKSCDTVITTACKEPEKALRWLDFFYGGEGQLMANFGIEGLSYKMVDGVPVSDFTGALEKEPGKTEEDLSYLYKIVGTSVFPMRMSYDAFAAGVHEYSLQGINRWIATADSSRILPNISLTAEEMEEINDMLVDIQTYALIQIDKLINGQTPLSDIPAIQDKLREMGVEECIEIYQNALDRYMGE